MLFCEKETMESRGSSLNPDAPPFIPLSKKGAHVTTRVTTSKDSKGTTTNTNSLTQAFLDFHIDEMERPRTQKGFTVKGQSAMASYNSSTSESVNGFEEKFDMDLTFLKMSFPDIAYQSLVDAYDFNQRDLEETLDMLIELQVIFFGISVMGFILVFAIVCYLPAFL